MAMLAWSVNGRLFIRTDAVIYPTRDGHEIIDDGTCALRRAFPFAAPMAVPTNVRLRSMTQMSGRHPENRAYRTPASG
jgi:hypothetical protein